MGAPIAIVVNPRSQGGRTGQRLGELESLARAALGEVQIRATASLGDGSRQAAEAVAGGARLVIACGGDGTASEVVEGLIGAGPAAAAFGLLPAGTGSDLARTLGMPARWPEALAAIRDATPRRTDALRGTFTSADGRPAVRHGINVVGMGLAGDVVRRVNASRKLLGGTVTFLGATLAALAAWRPVVGEVRWTDPAGADHAWTGSLTNVFVANGRYCGSGMCVGPAGAMDDGVLELVIVPTLPLPRVLAEFPRLYDGTLPDSRYLISARAVRVEVRSEGGGAVPCDLDGEQPGWWPASVEVLPGVLDVRAPWAPPRRRES